jgi:transposase InsO family protein
MPESDEEARLTTASFRYRLIADAVEVSADAVTAAVAEAAARSYLDPGGTQIEVSERTLWRWLAAYRQAGLLGLQPKARKDRGKLLACPANVLEMAARLRRENEDRATKTIIDILERKKVVEPGALARSTLDRHLDRMGLSRRRLHKLGRKTHKKVRTDAPFELVVADFHHGPYIRLGDEDQARRALLLAFIDHFSRYVPEGRYYLHEDFAALRFGFRLLLIAFGLFPLLYVDRGPSFQSNRFHAACSHELINIVIVHSKPYVSEGRGVVERFNRTVKEQFESEVRARDELLTLDELNAYFQAWLAERYHKDEHSETGQPPAERFTTVPPLLRPAPETALIDELLRLRNRRKVHKKWSTAQVQGRRYVVDPALRGRKVHVLYDPFDPAYVLIEFDGRIVQRAYLQKPGEAPPKAPENKAPDGPKTDYLALLRADYETRTRAELSALRLRPPAPSPELSLVDLVDLIQCCRGSVLEDKDRSEVAALFRKLRPIDPVVATTALEGARRRLGNGLHLRVYLDALQTSLVRNRTKGKKK